MAKQDYKRNEKLYQVALRRDWKYSVKLVLIGLILGVVLIPAMLAGDPVLAPLSRTVSFVAWVFCVGFSGIALYRYFVQRREQSGREDN